MTASALGAQTPDTKGNCYEWEEGDAVHLMSCKPMTLAECSKGKKSIDVKSTAFQFYKGKLFQAPGNHNIVEFLVEAPSGCKQAFIGAARGAEGTMSSNWNYAVYSEKLAAGHKAFVYGTSVILRDSPSTKGKQVAVLKDRAPVKIVGKSKERDAVKDLFPAYWFQVTVDGKTGWVYGQFIHPDPNSTEEFIR